MLIGVLVACKMFLLPMLLHRSCSLASWYALPVGITSIGSQETKMLCQACTHVTLPDSITSIAPLAFFGCRSLVSVALPASIGHLNRPGGLL